MARYYLAEAGIATAMRFLDQAEHAFSALSQMPRMGALMRFRQPYHADIRRWHIDGFPRLLVLYRPLRDGIELVRLLDAARDIDTLFADTDVPASDLTSTN